MKKNIRFFDLSYGIYNKEIATAALVAMYMTPVYFVILAFLEGFLYAISISFIILVLHIISAELFQNVFGTEQNIKNCKTFLYHFKNNNVIYDPNLRLFKIRGLKYIKIFIMDDIFNCRRVRIVRKRKTIVLRIYTSWELKMNTRIIEKLEEIKRLQID